MTCRGLLVITFLIVAIPLTILLDASTIPQACKELGTVENVGIMFNYVLFIQFAIACLG